MVNMPQTWFEMRDITKHYFDKDVWIPLKEMRVQFQEGKFGYLGYREEYFGVGSIAVPLAQRNEAEKLGWTDIGTRSATKGHVENGVYIPATTYMHYDGLVAENLVLERTGNKLELTEWFLNQDLVCMLELKRESDSWLAISRGYEEVAKINKDVAGKPISLYIKAIYLKDYLCARQMSLYMTSYRERRQVVEDASHISWGTNKTLQNNLDTWEGRVTEIAEGGDPYGSGYAVFHVSRTDVNCEDDVPVFENPNDENVETKSYEGKFGGKKLYFIWGELYRNEWIEPGLKSYYACDTEPEPTSYFITDNAGITENAGTLVDGIRWLWFNPSVINAVLGIRGSNLSWYTRDTGSISCSPDYGLHFGINRIGLINIFAKDIALLPDWQQRTWAGYSVSPDGKVSEELLMSQMKATPALTQAPEPWVLRVIGNLDEHIQRIFGISVIKIHTEIDNLIDRVHRFRAIENDGLLELAKDLYRILGEGIDASKIKNTVNPQKEEKWGQLKALEKLLALKIDGEYAHQLVTPLWGVYSLRIANSHLPGGNINEAYQVCRIDTSAPKVFQGYQIIDCGVMCINDICKVLTTIEE